MALAFVPFYLHFLGAAGFGLIGFFLTFSALISVMDGGLGAMATRETAALSNGSAEDSAQLRDTLRTIEILLWTVAVAAGAAFFLLAPLIGEYWLRIPPDKAKDFLRALGFMAGALALQFPLGFYNGCLIGLQRQVALNAVNAVFATLRGGGAVLALWLISTDASTFFAWQCVVGLLSLVYMHFLVWRTLGTGKGRFRMRTLDRSGRFAASVGAINVLGLILTQIDKILLSKLLPLQAYGYYMIAWTAGTLALRAAGPVFNTYYPVLTQLATTTGDRTVLRHTYLQGASLLPILVAPVTASLCFFGTPLLLAWTRDTALAEATALPLALISLGTMFNAFMHVPYALQLAHGRTCLALAQNLVAIALLPPVTIYCTLHYGLAGAGAPWLVLNLGYILLGAPLAHRGVLEEALGSWWRRGVIAPTAISFLLTGLFYAWSLMMPSSAWTFPLAAIGLLLSFAACVLAVGLDGIVQFITAARRIK